MRSDIVKQRWTTEEKAFILNWTDYCLYYALDYRKTIMEELRQYSPQNSYDAEKIRAQVCYLARLYRHEGMDAGPVTIYEKGTRYLDAAKMPSDLKRKMNSQRSEWSIGNLDEVDKHIPLKRHKKMSKRLPQRAPAKPLHTTPTQPKPTPPTRSNKAHISRSSQEAGPGHIPPESEVDTVIVAQPITVEGSSMVSGPSSPVLRSPTMSAITTHSHTPDLPSSRVTPPNASQDLPTAVSDLFQVVNWMVEGVIKTHARDDVPKHIIDRLISIQRTINADPKVTISRLAQDLVGAEEANATLCRTLGNLAGDQHWLMHLNFPSTPSTADLAETWNVLRSRLQSVDSSTRERAPDLYVAEHLAKRSEKFMSDKSPYPDPLGWVDDLKGLCVSPHAAQTVMSVAFLTSLFPMYPEPIYDQRSWEIPSRLLEMVEHLEGGTKAVQLHTLCLKFLFESKDFQATTLPHLVDTLATTWSETWETLRPDDASAPSVASSRPWIKRAIHLKQDLMMSQMEYKIRYCQPGDPFDASWMQAENDRGFVAPESCDRRTVLVCLFPALFQHSADTKAVTYAKNKRLFLARNEEKNFAHRDVSIIARAVVWLQE